MYEYLLKFYPTEEDAESLNISELANSVSVVSWGSHGGCSESEQIRILYQLCLEDPTGDVQSLNRSELCFSCVWRIPRGMFRVWTDPSYVQLRMEEPKE